MGTIDGRSSRCTACSVGGVVPGNAPRSTGERRSVQMSTYVRAASTAACWAIIDSADLGCPQIMVGWRCSTRQASVAASSLGRCAKSAEMLVRSVVCKPPDGERTAPTLSERPIFATDRAPLSLAALRCERRQWNRISGKRRAGVLGCNARNEVCQVSVRHRMVVVGEPESRRGRDSETIAEMQGRKFDSIRLHHEDGQRERVL